MESWIKSVWVKRLIPFVLIAAVWGGYRWWTDRAVASELAEEHRYALATAKAWVGSANFRNDANRYLAYRDSILMAEDLSTERMRAFEGHYSKDPEVTLRFSATVKKLVDSLVTIEQTRRKIKIDSTLVDE